VLLLNECLFLLLFISLSIQSGNFWIHPQTSTGTNAADLVADNGETYYKLWSLGNKALTKMSDLETGSKNGLETFT
jgi:hypothetical protein